MSAEDAFDEANEALQGTTSHISKWPRSVIARVEDGGRALRLYPPKEPYEPLLPAMAADEVDRFIAHLCNMRAAMKPRVPVTRPSEVPLHISERVRVRARVSEVGFTLDIRTDGLSWMSVVLSRAEMEALQLSLARTFAEAPRS